MFWWLGKMANFLFINKYISLSTMQKNQSSFFSLFSLIIFHNYVLFVKYTCDLGKSVLASMSKVIGGGRSLLSCSHNVIHGIKDLIHFLQKGSIWNVIINNKSKTFYKIQNNNYLDFLWIEKLSLTSLITLGNNFRTALKDQ